MRHFCQAIIIRVGFTYCSLCLVILVQVTAVLQCRTESTADTCLNAGPGISQTISMRKSRKLIRPVVEYVVDLFTGFGQLRNGLACGAKDALTELESRHCQLDRHHRELPYVLVTVATCGRTVAMPPIFE